MVIIVEVANFATRKSLVDQGSFLTFYTCLPFDSYNFLNPKLVNANTSYNILIGPLTLNSLGVIVFTPHLAMEFPSLVGKRRFEQIKREFDALDMLSVNPSFLCHKLSICPEARPVLQKNRRIGENNNIDWSVDGVPRYEVFNFLDVYSGYNQIKMFSQNEEKATFMREYPNYCYQVMFFDLKIYGATYQRLMDWVFANQIGKNLEVYVDDMVVNSSSSSQHMANLEENFGQIKRYNMRLNSEKCVFRIQREKFLSFMLTYRGIEANHYLV
ncbi:Retrovirus-related Pol polyprotein from transposon 17.6, partial [Mucuna pruriens]